MTARIPLLILIVGMLVVGMAGCVSGTHPVDTYVASDGSVTRIESGRESCNRSCNQDFARCMDSRSAGDNNSGVIGPAGIFGASGDCRNALQKCLPGCKSQ